MVEICLCSGVHKPEDTEVYAVSDPLFSTLVCPTATGKLPSKSSAFSEKWEVTFLLRGEWK